MEGEIIHPIGFDAGDKNVIVGTSEGTLRWPIRESFEGEITLESPVRLPVGLGMGRISADGMKCAVAFEDRCEVFSTANPSDRVQTGSQPGMRFIDLSPDGSLMASGAWHHPGVVIWDTKTGRSLKELPSDEEAATVAFSPDGRRLVTATQLEYNFLDVGSWKSVLRIPQQPGNDFAAMMCFSRDGKILAGTHSRNVVRLFDAATGQTLADLESPDPRMVASLSFNADGTQLAVSEGVGAIRIWDLKLIREQLAGMGLDWEESPSAEMALKMTKAEDKK